MERDLLCEGRAVFQIELHPAYSGRAQEGVQLQLQSRLFRWDEELGGVLLAVTNLQKLPSQAVIRPYFPYLQFKVAADVLLFRPRIGAIVCGQVTKLGADFIGMTILGCLNAAVGRQNIRPDLYYKVQEDSWVSHSDSDSTIQLGTDVIFCVERLRKDANGLLAVLGSLKEFWMGAAKAAALKRPEAFPDAPRWQHMQPQMACMEDLLAPLRNTGLTPDPAGATTVVTKAWQTAAVATAAEARQGGGGSAEATPSPDSILRAEALGEEVPSWFRSGTNPDPTISSAGRRKKAKREKREGEAAEAADPPDLKESGLPDQKETKKRKKQRRKWIDAEAGLPLEEALPAQPQLSKPVLGHVETSSLLRRDPSAAKPAGRAEDSSERGLPNGILEDEARHEKPGKEKSKKRRKQKDQGVQFELQEVLRAELGTTPESDVKHAERKAKRKRKKQPV